MDLKFNNSGNIFAKLHNLHNNFTRKLGSRIISAMQIVEPLKDIQNCVG